MAAVRASPLAARLLAAPHDPRTPPALRPDAATLSALEHLVEECPKAHRKGIIPCLFLALAVFAPAVLPPDAPLPGLELCVCKASLPVAAGLGSSAAFSVSSAAALLDAWAALADAPGVSTPAAAAVAATNTENFAPPPTDALVAINSWAYAAEMVFHGAPSGLDNTVSTYGGALAYSKDPATGESSSTHVGDMPPLRLLVTNTKVPKETSRLVAGVRLLRDAMPAVVDPILTSIDAVSAGVLTALAAESDARATLLASLPPPAITEAAVVGDTSSSESLASGGGVPGGVMPRRGRGASRVALPEVSDVLYRKLQTYMRVNHALLNALGVGHAALDGVVAAAARHGCAGKLTGAGGGGCAITLLPPHIAHIDARGRVEDLGAGGHSRDAAAAIAAELRAAGYDNFETRLGGAGVLLAPRALP